MTGEPGAKQSHYLLLVFLQAKMFGVGQMSKKPLQQSMWKEEDLCNKNTSVHSLYRLFLECF